MLFNGAGIAEQMSLLANGSRLRFFRIQGTVTMDTAGVKRVDVNALGGADLVTVNDLSGTDVIAVNVDLAGTLSGAARPVRVNDLPPVSAIAAGELRTCALTRNGGVKCWG